jgi:hypothetical protein
MRFKLFIGAVGLMLSLMNLGCGKEGGTLNLTVESSTPAIPNNTGSNTSSKPLMSLWTETNNKFKLDLSSVLFAVSSDVTIQVITGQNCSCKVLIQGTEASGNVTLSGCAGTFPDCSSFNSTGTYAKSSSELQICDASNSCLNLR